MTVRTVRNACSSTHSFTLLRLICIEAHTSRTDSTKDEINARISRTEGNLSIEIMFKAIACFFNCDFNDVNFETAIVWVVTSCCYVAITIRRRMLLLFQHRRG